MRAGINSPTRWHYSALATISIGFAFACGNGGANVDAAAVLDERLPPDAEQIAVGADVVIDSGPVRGTVGNGMVIFKGIPFAAAPVGPLRFAPPVAPQPWTTARDASAFGSACPQNNQPGTAQSEDCLSLNVWAHTRGPRRPVMVWIHGGGFNEGAGSFAQYDGAALANNGNIIVVSINYRLGILGYLALPQLAASDTGTGNWAVRDQIFALQWVKNNIAKFGGDPQRVMIAGESAGGTAICTLLASPLAQGLYQAASMQSGLCRAVVSKTDMTGTFPSAFSVGVVVASALTCTSGDIAACLRSKPVADVLATQSNLSGYLDLGFGLHPMLPVVDGVVIDKRPMAAIRDGRGAVPLIVGSNRDDTSAFVYSMLPNQPGAFANYLDTIGQTSRKAELLAMYPPTTFGERGAGLAFSTDLAFACPALALASIRPSASYLYELTREVPNGPVAQFGAAHGFDFLLLFGTFATFGVTPSSQDNAIAGFMQQTWSAFANRGTPPSVGWPSMPAHLQIDASNSGQTVWRGGRCSMLQQMGLLPD
jgi:para-nitrobenzyl esterase